MITAIAHLKSMSPYGQSKHYDTPKLEKENYDDYEKRTWKERTHVNDDGYIFIPPMAFKNCLSDAAKYLGMKIKGKGQEKYTKNFEAGVLVVDPLVLPVKKDDVPGLWLFVPADGRRGGPKRVNKCFPVLQNWEGTVPFIVFDETITEDVFRYTLEQAGKFIGIGFFRPRNNGYFGRFAVEKLEWVKE